MEALKPLRGRETADPLKVPRLRYYPRYVLSSVSFNKVLTSPGDKGPISTREDTRAFPWQFTPLRTLKTMTPLQSRKTGL